MSRRGSASDPQWYKDAVIYQLHVRSFFDQNNDGIGDFTGLIEKLDYLKELGVSCLWLLPFYPSPLRDDGYDIAHYEDIHPSYGTMKDFRAFLRAAHDRGLQVVTELVINHTSDQHPWFQAARRAPAGSAKRDYYVWSDTKQRYEGARIIFTDSETSNWQWDPVANAYYWHRFFFHQPDLNFDNPHVRNAVLKVMRFWFDQGVDGMRLDAVPYLIEREGTTCENLPETHQFLRDLRSDLDARYEARMLLAEANQWPADVCSFYGEGDECHMAFNFPLMPRMYMALRQEDSHPIADILRQTPEIPSSCQWALFLRNHDELTLEMVTDEERDYLYQAYASDPQMRINGGIRRRLAPLMENDRQRIELLTGLLFALPGTPVVYYGDEIGMGDNIYLGDRNAVRTPMQWTSDRNGGFSRADPARLFAPMVMDPVYGYQGRNVEAQERSPASLLNWMKRAIALRRRHRAFGRGTLTLLSPANRKVLAFIRQFEDETILCVANLSRTPQPAELDLSAFKGRTPLELTGDTEFPRIGEVPYFITLGRYAAYWFLLRDAPEPPVVVRPAPRSAPKPVAGTDLDPLLLGPAWDKAFDSATRSILERLYLPQHLATRRWFSAKSRALHAVRIRDHALVSASPAPGFLTLLDVRYADGGTETYCVPLAFLAGVPADELLKESPDLVVARVSGARRGVLHERLDLGLAGQLVQAILNDRVIASRSGHIVTARFPALAERLGHDRARQPADRQIRRRPAQHVVPDWRPARPQADSARRAGHEPRVRGGIPSQRTRAVPESAAARGRRGARPRRRALDAGGAARTGAASDDRMEPGARRGLAVLRTGGRRHRDATGRHAARHARRRSRVWRHRAGSDCRSVRVVRRGARAAGTPHGGSARRVGDAARRSGLRAGADCRVGVRGGDGGDRPARRRNARDPARPGRVAARGGLPPRHAGARDRVERPRASRSGRQRVSGRPASNAHPR